MKPQIYTSLQYLLQRIKEVLPEFVEIEGLEAVDPSVVTICDKDSLAPLLELHPLLKTFVLSNTPSFQEGEELLALGAKGYANTYIHETHLMQALSVIESGNIWLYPEFMQHLITKIQPKEPKDDRLELLTEREKEIAQLVAKGMTNKEMASELSITERTVKNHLSHIFEKLQVTDRLSLALMVNA